jgi:hypothetical protein
MKFENWNLYPMIVYYFVSRFEAGKGDIWRQATAYLNQTPAEVLIIGHICSLIKKIAILQQSLNTLPADFRGKSYNFPVASFRIQVFQELPGFCFSRIKTESLRIRVSSRNPYSRFQTAIRLLSIYIFPKNKPPLRFHVQGGCVRKYILTFALIANKLKSVDK